MNIEEAEKFVYGWMMWDRGFSDGIAHATKLVEALLCHKGTCEPQRGVLLGLYESLLSTSSNRLGAP